MEALSEYHHAYRLRPQEPLVLLSIACAYIAQVRRHRLLCVAVSYTAAVGLRVIHTWLCNFPTRSTRTPLPKRGGDGDV